MASQTEVDNISTWVLPTSIYIAGRYPLQAMGSAVQKPKPQNQKHPWGGEDRPLFSTLEIPPPGRLGTQKAGEQGLP